MENRLIPFYSDLSPACNVPHITNDNWSVLQEKIKKSVHDGIDAGVGQNLFKDAEKTRYKHKPTSYVAPFFDRRGEGFTLSSTSTGEPKWIPLKI